MIERERGMRILVANGIGWWCYVLYGYSERQVSETCACLLLYFTLWIVWLPRFVRRKPKVSEVEVVPVFYRVSRTEWKE